MTDQMRSLRNPDIIEYPELEGYTKNQIYHNFIGCGGLYLATKMTRQMHLKKGDLVLDLGCGMGTSSIYLAKRYDVTVISVDFWNSPDLLAGRAMAEGFSNKIIPIQTDITQTIPFARNYFDAIFCMNSLFMFGDNTAFIKKLLATLKPGGTFCIGSECFNQEPSISSKLDIPIVYNFDWQWDVWGICYSKYHSPQWWHSLIDSAGLLDIKHCSELEDGRILFEDFVLNYDNYLSENIRAMGAVIPQEKFVEQIRYGDESGLYSTLYILAGIRK